MTYSYINLEKKYLSIDELDFAVKVGYPLKYKGKPHETQEQPYNIELYELPDGAILVVDQAYVGYEGGYDIAGVYLAIPETEEDRAARSEREESKRQAEKDARAQERAAKKVSKQQDLDKARKLVEKAGYKVIK